MTDIRYCYQQLQFVHYGTFVRKASVKMLSGWISSVRIAPCIQLRTVFHYRHSTPLNLSHPGASTPYKRWSKCTMEKVGGERFFRNLGGSALIINTLPPKFLQKRWLIFLQIKNHNLMFHFLKSSGRSLLLEARFLAWNSPNTVWRPGSARTRWGS